MSASEAPSTSSAYPTFSSTVRLSSSLKSWKTTPMLRRRYGTPTWLIRPMFLPPIRICPLVGFSAQKRSRKSVLLPAPEGPVSQMNSPLSTPLQGRGDVVSVMLPAHRCPAPSTNPVADPLCGETLTHESTTPPPSSNSATPPASGPASAPPSPPPSAPASPPPVEMPCPPPSIGLIAVEPFVYDPAQAQSEASAKAAAELLVMATSAAPGLREGTRGSPRRGSSR